MVYLIGKDRLLLEYERNLKRRSNGVLNWFIKDDYLNILIDIHSVTYLYRELVTEIQPLVKMMLSSRMSILGTIELDDLFKEKEEVIEYSEPDVMIKTEIFKE